MTIKQIGIDIGKMTFHMVALDEANNIVIRRQFTRSQLITFFRKRADGQNNTDVFPQYNDHPSRNDLTDGP